MKYALLSLALMFAGSPARALSVPTDSPAPDFKGSTSEKKEIKLSDYKGKIVVLEWLNHGCPFVKKHYGSKNMQTLQAEYTKKGVVWISVISSAEGKQGYGTPEQVEAERLEKASHASAIILDPKGEIGKLYGAQTTPHMYVINKKGLLVYQGAIDSKPSTDTADIKTARPYLRDALDAVLEDRAVAKSQTKSYGCSVKYN